MMNDIHDTPDTIIKLNLQGTDFNVFTRKRPGVDVFLAAVGQLYEVRKIQRKILFRYKLPSGA